VKGHFMKKTYFFALVIFFACIFISCKSLKALKYPEPSFDRPSAYVIDAFESKGSFEDYIKLHNFSSDSDISFNIYVHRPDDNKWLLYGVGLLKDPGDTDTIDSDLGNIDNYRYFAIESKGEKTYKYQFYKRKNDLHIDILDN